MLPWKKIRGLLTHKATQDTLVRGSSTSGKKFFAKRMMTHAQQNDQIPELQYARKFTQSIEAVIVKHLFYKRIQIYKCHRAMISNNPCGCFNWIVLSVRLLAIQRLGVSWKPICSLLDTLQNMQYYIRTAHRDSCGYYSGSLSHPFQGRGG